jgi:hypothetical protein
MTTVLALAALLNLAALVAVGLRDERRRRRDTYAAGLGHARLPRVRLRDPSPSPRHALRGTHADLRSAARGPARPRAVASGHCCFRCDRECRYASKEHSSSGTNECRLSCEATLAAQSCEGPATGAFVAGQAYFLVVVLLGCGSARCRLRSAKLKRHDGGAHKRRGAAAPVAAFGNGTMRVALACVDAFGPRAWG